MNGPIWVAELVERFNAEFVPQPADQKRIDQSQILEADPEVLVVTWPGVDDPPLDRIYTREGWSTVTAIRNRHVKAIPEIWVNSPGPNLLRGARELARAIHPSAPLSESSK
ncbi:MAG TPA: ABC transporter substrate-binding protein [Planctomycetaceae bacterium]|nr:ABC transporter substrate-binding protein [Planctomycetaceae bacterium]